MESSGCPRELRCPFPRGKKVDLLRLIINLVPSSELRLPLEEDAGTLDAAEKAYRLAYRRDPGHTPTLIRLSRVLLGQEQWSDALPIVQALQLRQHGLASSEKVFVFNSLAEIWMETGELRRASQFLQRALQLEPGNEEAVALSARLEETA